MCIEVRVVSSDGCETDCCTVRELADALSVEAWRLAPFLGGDFDVCLCVINDELLEESMAGRGQIRDATSAEGWPIPSKIIELFAS